jgi:two-component sensor histidine kinase
LKSAQTYENLFRSDRQGISVGWKLEEEQEESPRPKRELLDRISQRIESLYSAHETHMEEISLVDFLDEICNEAITSMENRDLGLTRRFERGLSLIASPQGNP